MLALMGFTPIERLARWWAEPRVRRCANNECRAEIAPISRRERGEVTCSDECAEAVFYDRQW